MRPVRAAPAVGRTIGDAALGRLQPLVELEQRPRLVLQSEAAIAPLGAMAVDVDSAQAVTGFWSRR
jgi:hypothetical protein